jgi:glycine oxidase
MRVAVVGAGVAGLTAALELAVRGAEVEVFERQPTLTGAGCSWYAGGMLAPWCELESAPALIAELGVEGLGWWRTHWAETAVCGTLVVAHGRDHGELTEFARRTRNFEELDAAGVARLEPELAGRFSRALYFAGEGHLDPRAALTGIAAVLAARGVPLRLGAAPTAAELAGRRVLDCSGLAARRTLSDLRGVKGEMLLLRQPQLTLNRPVRVLHPRLPLYVVPRGPGLYMVGASMLESDDGARVSARSLLELLSAAYALHPAFGEAEVLEIGSGVRAAFPDNLPRLRWVDDVLFLNGLFRHGFLVAPALARRAAQVLLEAGCFVEVMDESARQRRLA